MLINYFRYDTWVKTAQGPAVPGAQVYVCTQPANTAVAPPSPLALIYADPHGLVPITQPIITDGFGHADFYALAGLYTVVVALGGTIQQVYPDQSLGGIGTGGAGTALVLSTNGVINTSQMALNLQNTDGALSLASDAFGNVTINNPAMPPGGTAGQVLTKVNGTSFDTQWTSPSSGPSYSTVGQGGFWSAGYDQTFLNCGVSSSGPVSPEANNSVWVYQFTLGYNIAVGHLSTWITTGIGAQTVNFGVYSAAGSKILDSGAIPASATGAQSVSITPVTLLAGVVYYFAQSSSNTNVSTITIGQSAQYNTMKTLVNTYGIRIGEAANTTSAGVMPATLGTITPDTGDDVQMAAVLFEP